MTTANFFFANKQICDDSNNNEENHEGEFSVYDYDFDRCRQVKQKSNLRFLETKDKNT